HERRGNATANAKENATINAEQTQTQTQRKRDYRPAHMQMAGTVPSGVLRVPGSKCLDLHVRVETQRSSSRLAAVRSQAKRTHALHVMVVVATFIPAGRGTCSQFLFCSDTGENAPQPIPGSEPTYRPGSTTCGIMSEALKARNTNHNQFLSG
ncbi:hypothetical protein PspLS_02012, partial [Pyricularia sp. CBS 133598]